jgi:NHL repeat
LRSHAKAPTAGSTQRQAKSLGRTRFAPTAVLAVAIAALCAFVATPASAALSRSYETSFGSFSGQNPQAIAVDQSNGDIYAASIGANTVSRFNSSGLPKNFTAGPDAGTNTLTGFNFESASTNEIAIDRSGGPADGTIYVANILAGNVKVFAEDGTPLTSLNGSGTPAASFSEPCGVAVDQANGDLYVGQYGNRVWRYSPSTGAAEEGDYSGGIATSINPCQVAVASGSLYAANWETKGPLEKYATSAFALGAPPSPAASEINGKATAVATDPSNGDVYVDEGDKISVFNSSGAALYSFGSGDFGTASAGVAVRAGGNAYVADPSGNQVDVYGPFSAPPPLPTTNPATAVKHTKATLHGHLDPNGGLTITACEFEWGTDTSYGEPPLPCGEGSSFSAPADVTAALSGLSVGTTYHFRLSISTANGKFSGDDRSFTATPVPVGHSFLSAFGSSGLGDGQFSENAGLALDQSSGDVYVADTANHRIEKFDADGGFVSAWGWGVDDGSAAAQVCTSGCQAGIAGSGAGQLASPKFVAVDNSGGPSDGDVYVADRTSGTVVKFDSAGNYISTNDGSASGSAFGPLAGIAVGAGGDLWTYDSGGEPNHTGVMREFAQDGGFVTQWNSGYQVTAAGIAVDSSDHLYVARGTPSVEKFTSSGGDVGAVTAGGNATGFVVDPATDDLYVDAGGTEIDRYASSCDPSGGPCEIAESFGVGDLNAANAIAVKGSSGRAYVSDPDTVKIFNRGTLPEVVTGTGTALSAGSASLDGTVDANGVALVDCHFEYVSDEAFLAAGFNDLSSGGSVPCDQAPGSIPVDFEDHPVSAMVGGLDPAKLYHFRLVAANALVGARGQDVLISGQSLVETTGSPTRTATTARLDSRVDPHGTATTYHFEYGDQGPCDSNPCTATAARPAGSDNVFEFVSQQIGGLQPSTTYHYRVVADNGTPGGPAFGAEGTLTTRTSDAPLGHGHFAGPPGSDRAWEQVNVPDTGGNPVSEALAISDNGDRAVYQINGGSPGSDVGFSNQLFAERTSVGWQAGHLYPGRTEAQGNAWEPPIGRSDLSRLFAVNTDATVTGTVGVWHLSPGAPAQQVFGVPAGNYVRGVTFVSEDGSRVISEVNGDLDPDHPITSSRKYLYDVSSGTPHMVSLLPDGSVPSCGVPELLGWSRAQHWISPDGSLLFFTSSGNGFCGPIQQLYVRDLETETTTQVSPGSLNVTFLRSTPGAVFFMDRSSGSDSNVYRYDLGDESLDCLTCFPGIAADVRGEDDLNIAVSEDGSRVYFSSPHRLVPGAADSGLYRLDVASGELAYVAPVSAGDWTGQRPKRGNAINPDGSVFVFRSDAPALNSLNGPQNGGTAQYYRYDDDDRSLVCVSCPADGSPPRGQVPLGFGGSAFEAGPNLTPLSRAGDLAFPTPTALVSADQNTAGPGQPAETGTDIYEWRDGRLLLVTDGLTTSSVHGVAESNTPEVAGVTPSGHDIFFTQAAQLTPGAIDGFKRLYDARIGGGFEFPTPPPPCPLEACQGSPKGVPEESRPGSADYAGAGNAASHQARCRKGKVRRRGRCVAKHQKKRAKRAQHRADHDRRASR